MVDIGTTIPRELVTDFSARVNFDMAIVRAVLASAAMTMYAMKNQLPASVIECFVQADTTSGLTKVSSITYTNVQENPN